jgi:hypothetical protein
MLLYNHKKKINYQKPETYNFIVNITIKIQK